MPNEENFDDLLKPNPGSDKAIEAGCQCPVLDNGHGAGSGQFDEQDRPLFWMNEHCPIHGKGATHDPA